MQWARARSRTPRAGSRTHSPGRQADRGRGPVEGGSPLKHMHTEATSRNTTKRSPEK